jgi:hypothetical protein
VIHSRLLVDSIHGWIHTTVSFSYDKVFDHNALQENVFVEISQLVQRALDGYKVNNLQCLVIPNDCFIEYELLFFD